MWNHLLWPEEVKATSSFESTFFHGFLGYFQFNKDHVTIVRDVIFITRLYNHALGQIFNGWILLNHSQPRILTSKGQSNQKVV